MKNLLIIEIKNCLKRKEFKFIFSILMFLALGSFLSEILPFYSSEFSYLRSRYETGMIQGVYASYLKMMEIFLLPLFAVIIYSDSYYVEKNCQVYKAIITRENQKKYISAKALTIFFITFITFLIPMIVNQFLCGIIFPKVGLDNNFSLPPYDIGVQNYHSELLFDFTRIQNPLVYNVIYMIIISITAALLALLAYALFLIYTKNKLSIFLGVFAAYLAMAVLLPSKYSLMTYLKEASYVSVKGLLIWWLLLLISSIVIITYKVIQSELES